MLQKKDALVAEIIRKIGNLTVANIYMKGAGHIRNHIGRSDMELTKRIKREHVPCASSFYDEAVLEKSIFEAFTMGNNYGAKQVAKWLLTEPTKATFELEGFSDDGMPVGRIMFPDGTVEESSTYVIVLERRDDISERSRTTGMPFDVVTAYIESEN